LDQVLEVFGIAPDTDLNLMQPDQTLGAFTSRAIGAIDQYLSEEKPDLVLVQGDTSTVFCASLTSFYHHIPVGHVEAGLRTGNMQAPWPEEANRVLTSKLAALHFSPTETARQNLLREGVSPGLIHVTGNTVIDALFYAVKKNEANVPEIPGLPGNSLTCFDHAPVVLITGHRRESFGPGFENICRAIRDLAVRFPQVHFVYPVHLNPNVRAPVKRILDGQKRQHDQPIIGTNRSLPALNNIHLIEPLSYLPFVALMNRATIVLTDSGGVQEEAPSLAKPVLVMRETTERSEAVNSGAVKVVGTDYQTIVLEVGNLLCDASARSAMTLRANPYGDGQSAGRIIHACGQFFNEIE
jgi:UDP-N-acetylglucosamine 2-epimerase (non-hydrolysing)